MKVWPERILGSTQSLVFPIFFPLNHVSFRPFLASFLHSSPPFSTFSDEWSSSWRWGEKEEGLHFCRFSLRKDLAQMFETGHRRPWKKIFFHLFPKNVIRSFWRRLAWITVSQLLSRGNSLRRPDHKSYERGRFPSSISVVFATKTPNWWSWWRGGARHYRHHHHLEKCLPILPGHHDDDHNPNDKNNSSNNKFNIKAQREWRLSSGSLHTFRCFAIIIVMMPSSHLVYSFDSSKNNHFSSSFAIREGEKILFHPKWLIIFVMIQNLTCTHWFILVDVIVEPSLSFCHGETTAMMMIVGWEMARMRMSNNLGSLAVN